MVVLALTMTLANELMAARTQQLDVTFNLTGSLTSPSGGKTNKFTVLLIGSLKVRDGALFLPPLQGTMYGDGVANNIQVSAAKQSEPIGYTMYSSWDYRYEQWTVPVIVDVQRGVKGIGILQWYHQTDSYGGDYSGTYLSFQGVIGGTLVNGNFWMQGLP